MYSDIRPFDRAGVWRALRVLAGAWRLVAVLVVLAAAPMCTIRDTVAHPTFAGGGLLAGAAAVPPASLAQLNGMFQMRGASPVLGGGKVAVHTTRDTVSIFAEPNAAYAVMHVGCLDKGTRLVMEGEWRFPAATSTGLIRMFVGPAAVAEAMCAGTVSRLPASVVASLEGATDNGSGALGNAAALDFDHPLKNAEGKFVVVAHHGACATIDDCGASENSLESIRMTESFGATVLEIDVHMTADGIPFLFHDDNFDARLSSGPFCHGPVDQFTLAAIRADCKLKFGETIPTLDEALATVVNETNLRGVWLDLKIASAVGPTVQLMTRYAAVAKAKRQRVNFVIGLGEADILAAYTSLSPPAPAGTLCLVELAPSDVRNAGCGIWGPPWTNGPSVSDVNALQAEGRSVAFWTMDEQQYIDLYLTTTLPNGIVTGRPGLVFHRFQVLGTLPPTRTQL